ncbi:MAG: hypothetical protein D6776_09965 [Planctomycetota bacterium]|nr:MAG: hypothetical protein D6776_09965 [Planctomycetota bacterium]
MFDTVWAIAAPPVAATLAPRVETELALDALRPIRGFTIRNSADPSIDTVLYTTSVPNQTGSPGSGLQTGTRSWLVARYPVPIPKRPSDGYLWSSSPFVLDGAVDPREQHPGQDISLPYWIARSHGLLP